MDTKSIINKLRGLLKQHESETMAPYRDWRLAVVGFWLTLLTSAGLTLSLVMGFGQGSPLVPVKQNSILSEEKLSTAISILTEKDRVFQNLKSGGFSVVDPSL